MHHRHPVELDVIFFCVTLFLLVPQQVRFSHTDVTNVPSFDGYRLNSTKDPHSVASKTEVQRKVFAYTIAFGKQF